MKSWIEVEVESMNGEATIGYVRKVNGGYEWKRITSIGTTFVLEEDKRDLPEWAYTQV